MLLCLLTYSVHMTPGNHYALKLIALFSMGCIFYVLAIKRALALDARNRYVRG